MTSSTLETALACALALLLVTQAQAQQSLPDINVSAARKRRIAPRPRPAETARPAAPQAERVVFAPTGPAVSPPAAPVLTANVLTSDALRRASGATLGEILSTTPGVTNSSYAPGAASRPIVRGLDNYRLRIQENGLAGGGVSELGEDHAVPVDPLAAKEVSILRGPAALRFSGAATGGVIEAANNRIPRALPCAAGETADEGCVHGETRGAVSTVDAGLESAATLDAGKGALALHADTHGRRASDYAIPGYPYVAPPPAPIVAGRQPNSAARSGGASLGGSYLFDRGYVGASVTQFDSLYHIPGADSAQADTRIALRQTKFAARGEFRPESSPIAALRFSAGASDYKHSEIGNEGGYDGVQQIFAAREQEGRVELAFAPLVLPVGALDATAGVQAAHSALSAPGVSGGLFDPNQTTTLSGFLLEELKTPGGLTAQGAARLDHADVAGAFAGGRRVFNAVSGAGSLAQTLGGGVVGRVSAMFQQRAPRAPELLSRGAHDATGTLDIGNPNLGLETAKTLELGLRRQAGALRFDLSVYMTRFDGFIFRDLTGESCDATAASCTPDGVGGDLRQAIYRQRNALFRGAEGQAQWDAAEVFGGIAGVSGQFDIVRATFASGGSVPRIPPARLGGGLYWRDAQWQARIDLLHAFAQNAVDRPFETTTPGYDRLKAELSWKTKLFPGAPDTLLGLTGDNLLGERMRNHVSFRKDETLLPGRSLRMFANIAF